MRVTDGKALFDGSLDLFLGSRCAGCSAPGRAFCPRCRALLPSSAAPAWPSPTPDGLAIPVATGEYAGMLRALVLAHKEHGRFALAEPLGLLLATAVEEVRRVRPVGPGLVLVPVPSVPSVVRSRGHDPLLRTVRAAAAVLRRRGVRTSLVPALRVSGRPEDQAGLDATERARNLAGRFVVRSGAAPARGTVVLVDDVITTGATAREAQRALEATGTEVAGIAVVAATRRRLPEPFLSHVSPLHLPYPPPGH